MADESASSQSHQTTTTPPSFINKEFIQEALFVNGEGSAEIANVDVSAATAVGDNYNSSIYRVTATLSAGGKRSFLVKTDSTSVFLSQNAREAGYFRRETFMLNHVIPSMETLLETVFPDHNPPLAARSPLFDAISPTQFLVLEDLAPQGFKLADRQRGLGLRHCLIALRALGRFHAASLALLNKEPFSGPQIGQPWDHMVTFLGPFVTASVTATAAACKKWPGFEEYAGYLEAFKDVAVKKYAELHDPRRGSFNVIIHGDFWTNNMMFRYKNGLPCEIRMVDFQISHYGSPSLDLLYFLSTSPTENVSRNYENLLINEYYSALSETMKFLKLQPPSLEALLADMDANGTYALFGSLGILPFVRAKTTPDLDAALAGDEAAGAFMYEDPDVKKWLQRVLPEYKRKGWLPQ